MLLKPESIGAQELMEEVLKPPVWLVEGLLPTSSTNLLCSPPKFGKSILCLQLCQSVAMGQPFLGKATAQAGAIYLCLEDTKYRLQHRLWALADESVDDFRLVPQAVTLAEGLIGQLEGLLLDYPGTKLFVVDTLQVARGNSGDYSYANDYADLRQFKSFADRHDVCVLIVHHLRKAESASDQFMDISGTTAISGAVDGMMVMQKEKRSSSDCRLSVTGRDVEYAELVLRRDGMRWEFVEQLTEAEAYEASVPDAVKAIVSWLANGVCRWSGTASELIEAVGIDGVSPAVLGKQLAQHNEWLRQQGVSFGRRRTGSSRSIELSLLA